MAKKGVADTVPIKRTVSLSSKGLPKVKVRKTEKAGMVSAFVGKYMAYGNDVIFLDFGSGRGWLQAAQHRPPVRWRGRG